jgi:hypothetical protein
MSPLVGILRFAKASGPEYDAIGEPEPRPPNKESAVSRDPNSPQVLTTVPTEQEAVLIASQLDAVGIKAHIWSPASFEVSASARGGYQVVVRQADLEQIKRVLEQMKS